MEKSTNINERNYQKLTSLKALSLEVALLRIEKQKKFLLQNKKRIIGQTIIISAILNPRQLINTHLSSIILLFLLSQQQMSLC